jgi:hypothetical protein
MNGQLGGAYIMQIYKRGETPNIIWYENFIRRHWRVLSHIQKDNTKMGSICEE